MLRIKELYNILSLALKKVEECTNEHDFEQLRNIEESYENEIIDGLKNKFPDMFDEDTINVSEVSDWLLEGSFLIDNLHCYLEVSENKTELIYLIKYLDMFLEDTVYGYFPVDQEQYHFYCLNDNFEKCGICLLPRLKCYWEHQNREAYTSYDIYYYLRNFYYVREKDLEDYKVQHILMSKDLFEAAVQRGELRIMVSPILGDNILEMTEPYTKDNSCFVSIKPIKPDVEEKIQTISLNVLEEAVCEEADILILPEMLGTDKIVGALSDELYTRKNILDNEFPRLMISPTVWNQHNNYGRVMNDIGETLCVQYKHHGVDFEQKQIKVKEDITSDHKIYIFHCHGIGRIAVAICKDFLITKYLKILAEHLKVSLLLVPSFTRKDHQFKKLILKYGEKDCNVIWINSCSSRWLNENGKVEAAVTLAYLPGKRGNLDVVEKDVNHFCEGLYSCNGKCIYLHRILLDVEVER